MSLARLLRTHLVFALAVLPLMSPPAGSSAAPPAGVPVGLPPGSPPGEPDAPGDPGFRDDFSSYAEGSSGAPRWKVLRGEWKVRGGKLVQTSPGEGNAIVREERLPGRFRLEARFRTTAGIPAEGLLFGLPSAQRLGPCHLVRVDPEGLYYGSLDASGELRGEGPVPAFVEGGAWNTLAVDADEEAGTYRVELNGKEAAAGIPLEHAGGLAGLTSSWGESEFALCAVAPLSRAPQRGLAAAGAATPAGAGSDGPRQPADIARHPTGLLAILDRAAPPLHLLRPDLSAAKRLGRLLEGDKPIAVDAGPDGALYVLDEAKGRIDRYPAEGGLDEAALATLDPAAPPRSIEASPPLEGPRGLAVLPDGRIAVAETGARRVVVLSQKGERLAEVGKPGGGPGEHERPSDVAADSRGRLLVADFKGCRVQAFAPGPDGAYRLEARSPWLAPPGRLAVLPGDRVAVLGRFAYYETGGALRLLEPSLLPRGFSGCFAAGGLSEEGGIAAADGTIACLSRRDGRLYRFPLDFQGPLDVDLRVSHAGDRTRIEWTARGASGAPGASRARLEYREERAAEWTEAPGVRGGSPFAAEISGLDPRKAYELRFLPHHEVLQLGGEPAEAWSRVHRFHGPPPAGHVRFLDLSVLCAVYLAYEDDEGRRRSVPREALGDKLEREFEVARRFFARNSRLRLHVHADFEYLDGPVAKVKHGWLDPGQARRDLAPLLEKRGRKVDDYDSLIGMWAEPGFRADRPDDPGTVGGGGLTSFGYSTFGSGGRAAWLFAHEYHHQVDAFFNRSGYLEYPLNHPDATVQPGRYGQHWDCNAFFLRSWPEEAWLASRFGKVLLAADADSDGVPDRDPRLPFDEARLGSDPARRDSDEDGLSDLDELAAGTFRGADPARADTDSDGARDGDDARPLDAAFTRAPELRRGSPRLDGAIASGEWQLLGRIPEAGAEVFGRWDPEHLYVAVRAERPVRCAFELDGANDGWFLEDDNRSLELEADGSAAPRAHGAGPARTAGERVDGSVAAEAALPWSAVPAVRPAEGTRFGLCVRVTFREGEGERAWDRELFLADPWELLELRLAGGDG